MKKLTGLLSLVLVLALALSLGAFAAEGPGGLAGLPAGTYTYVDELTADGQLRYDRAAKTLAWRADGKSGSLALRGDALSLFEGLWLSDRPVTDWVGGAAKNVEGYAGAVAGGVEITVSENGKLSAIAVTNPATRAVAVLSAALCEELLTVRGVTRGRPNLLQSCITLCGSVNGLYLTKQGDVVLDELTIGCDDKGVGLRADKIGGDTFVVGTVKVDGTVEWHNKMGVLLPLESRPGVLETNGKDITVTGGSNLGRVGRDLTLSTGAGGGDIRIGVTVSTDSTRGGLTPTADTSKDGLTVNTRGSLLAGEGDVIIGTNTEKAVILDMVGDIVANNVTIRPTNRGAAADVTGSIGSVTAQGSIDIAVGSVNSGASEGGANASQGFTVWTGGGRGRVIGDLTAKTGSVSLTAGEVNGTVGAITAAGSASVRAASVLAVGEITAETVERDYAIGTVPCARSSAAVTLDGAAVSLAAYNIDGSNYFRLRDIAAALSGTAKQFAVAYDAGTNTAALTAGAPYAAAGEPAPGAETACCVSAVRVTLGGAEIAAGAYLIGGENYFRLRDIASALDFAVTWDNESKTIAIDTAAGYTE